MADALLANTPGVRVGADSTIRLDRENEPQPDVLLLIEPGSGGQARIDADGYVEGAPELVAEVAASSAAIDLHTKFRVYRRNNVREYLVWRVLDRAFDWFVLRGDEYVRLEPVAGACRSEQFPGLWLDPDALTRFDLAAVFGVLQHGLASPEHTAFMTRLQAARSRNG